MFNKKSTDMFKPNLNIFLQYFLQAGDINFMNLLVGHILSGLFLTNQWVEFNNILQEASILRGDVHTLKVLQLHVILQSYGLFTY